MKQFVVSFVCSLVPLLGMLHATSSITAINSFQEMSSALDEASENTLVIFDVDEVLLTQQDLAIRWFYNEEFIPSSWKGIEEEELFYLISLMARYGAWMVIDPTTSTLISQLNQRGIQTMACTACSTGPFGSCKNVEDWRIHQLKQFGIAFSCSTEKTIRFDDGTKTKNYAIFKEGVLFVPDPHTTKGDLVVDFLNKMEWRPDKVLFVDDKLSNLTSVEHRMQALGIPFEGFHFMGARLLPGSFDPAVADMQFSTLRQTHTWLSDAEAKAHLFEANKS